MNFRTKKTKSILFTAGTVIILLGFAFSGCKKNGNKSQSTWETAVVSKGVYITQKVPHISIEKYTT